MITGWFIEQAGKFMQWLGAWLVSLIPDAPPWPAVALEAWGTITITAGRLWWWCNFDAMVWLLGWSALVMMAGFSLRMFIKTADWAVELVAGVIP